MIFNNIVINVTHLSKINDVRNKNIDRYISAFNSVTPKPSTHPLPYKEWVKYIQKRCNKLTTTFTIEEKTEYVNIESIFN